MLTIALPVYNGALRIRPLLDSLVQNLRCFPEIEVLVLDNASTDKTLEVINSYRSKIARLRVISHENNIGPDSNFAECVRLAGSKYVWIIGDDDTLADGAVQEVLSVLSKNPDLVGVLCNFSICPANKVMIKESVIHLEIDQLVNSAAELTNIAGLNMNFLSAVVHSREHFLSVEAKKYYGSYWLQLGVFLEYSINKPVYVISRPIVINAGDSTGTEVNTNGQSVYIIKNMLEIVTSLTPTLGSQFNSNAKKFIYPNLLRKLYIGKKTGYKRNREDYEFFLANMPVGFSYRIPFMVLFYSPPWFSKLLGKIYRVLNLQKAAFRWLLK